LSAS
jgi:hypothetical protein